MQANYEVKLDKFSGPLEKLLELIEARELEITLINLGKVTGDFLDYLKKLSEKISYSFYAIDDNTAIKVVDSKISIVSEGEWKKFN